METLRIGVIGTSWWSDLVYFPILSAYERADLRAICGRNQERAKEMASKYGVPLVYADYRQMIAEANLDAIVISTPDDTHYEMAMAAMEVGLHVLCEKPIALNAEHARQMADKAKATGLKTLVLYTWRWMPQFQYIHQLLDQGYLGQPYHADFRQLAGYARDDKYRWRLDGERANGILGDLGSHIIDLVRWYFGEIHSVSAVLGNFRQRQGPDGGLMKQPANDSAAILLEFSNGAHASLHTSAVAEMGLGGAEIEFSLYGERGKLSSSQSFGTPVYKVWGVQQPDAALAEIPVPEPLLQHTDPGNVLAHFMQDSVGPRLFVDAIADDLPIAPSLYDGYKVQQVIDAALESHRTGQRITIDASIG